MNFTLRKAQLTDKENLEALIIKSAKTINKAFYSDKEIDAALGNAWTVDEQLIIDETYWIVENNEGLISGCGGWSKRKLLFGKSDNANSKNNELIPGQDPAKIRAFFVHPNFVRQGIGKKLLKKCEHEAIKMGFTSLELVATLSGEKLYSSEGYAGGDPYEIELGNGITNTVISMRKDL